MSSASHNCNETDGLSRTPAPTFDHLKSFCQARTAKGSPYILHSQFSDVPYKKTQIFSFPPCSPPKTVI